MIIHRTSYVFYDKVSDEPKLIADMKRSQGNRKKIIHKVNSNGYIIQSYYYDIDTQSLNSIQASQEMKIKSETQRKFVMSKHKILKSQDSKSVKKTKLNVESRKYFGKDLF